MSGILAHVAGLAVVLTVASGCALTSRGEPSNWRYFNLERVQPSLESAEIGGGEKVCLGRVTSPTSLGRRIAHGDGGYEVRYYEDRRWTEEPVRYVRRALERTLFQEGRYQCALETTPPILDVEVLRFEETKTHGSHATRVTLRIVLVKDRVLFDTTIQAVEPVTGSSFDDVVAALGRALDEASADVARRTGSALANAK